MTRTKIYIYTQRYDYKGKNWTTLATVSIIESVISLCSRVRLLAVQAACISFKSVESYTSMLLFYHFLLFLAK